MCHLARVLCVLAVLGVCSTVAMANDDIGPIFRSLDQTAFCMIYCDSDEQPCDFTVKIYSSEGVVLKSKSFANVPGNGIRKVTYAGVEKTVNCQTSNEEGDTQEPSWTVIDNRGNVVAMGTNGKFDGQGDVGPVWNARNQTPVCMVRCEEGPCDFRIEINGSQGQMLSERIFRDVPTRGHRQLAYAGSEKMISCEGKLVEQVKQSSGRAEPAWAILDVKGNIVAYMTNDSFND